mmetsp:Transcript_56722/g.130426  ORF Transcript_56722/g.130426 Transcript_56722/m.130426 type:complete len:289 (-) Transcript_56722:130-996(-)
MFQLSIVGESWPEDDRGEKFCMYLVCVENSNIGKVWTVQRRYREFRRLHYELRACMMLADVPALPPRSFFRIRWSQTFRRQRRAGLEAYLKGLLAVDSKMTCRVFHDFLHRELTEYNSVHPYTSSDVESHLIGAGENDGEKAAVCSVGSTEAAGTGESTMEKVGVEHSSSSFTLRGAFRKATGVVRAVRILTHNTRSWVSSGRPGSRLESAVGTPICQSQAVSFHTAVETSAKDGRIGRTISRDDSLDDMEESGDPQLTMMSCPATMYPPGLAPTKAGLASLKDASPG